MQTYKNITKFIYKVLRVLFIVSSDASCRILYEPYSCNGYKASRFFIVILIFYHSLQYLDVRGTLRGCSIC